MGSFASSVVPSKEKLVPTNLKPTNNADWILAHVENCSVPILKVQRCWHRFVQMGGGKTGTLTQKSKIYSSPDKFLKQVMALIPKNDKNAITFQVFVNACAWFESATPEIKAKLLFFLMNKGQPVDAALLSRVISHLYVSVSETELKELAAVTVQQIDLKNRGAFDEDDFVKWVTSKPAEDIEKIFAFSILPK